jgi:hypothetical protein
MSWGHRSRTSRITPVPSYKERRNIEYQLRRNPDRRPSWLQKLNSRYGSHFSAAPQPGSRNEQGSFSHYYQPQNPTRPGNQNPAPRPPGQGAPMPGGPGQGQVPYFSNLENNLPLPQGWHTSTAMPSTVSSLITSMLYQSRQAPVDYWSQMFGGGQRNMYGGYNPYGQRGGGRNGRGSSRGGSRGGSRSGYGSYGSYGRGGQQQGYGGMYGAFTNSNIYSGPNPWGSGKGAKVGDYGVASDPNYLTQGTYDALALADAYFAPKRLQLAYELGDMEVDMRRLAVNLGRQIDDPILQAKLYKEAMRTVRTIDSEQNQFAIQMVEQRRKEEIQNRQFYDQLALEERKVKLQNEQFQDQLSLQRQQLSMASAGAGG